MKKGCSNSTSHKNNGNIDNIYDFMSANDSDKSDVSKDDFVNNLTADTLLQDESFLRIFDMDSQLERTKFITALRLKAKSFGLNREFNDLLHSWQAEYAEAAKQNGSNILMFTDAPLPALRCGKWTANDYGVMRSESQNGFAAKKIIACPHPIEPIERLYNIDTQTEKIKLAFFRDKRWQFVTVNCGTCADKSQIVRGLADRGVEVTSKSATELVDYISEVIALNGTQIPKHDSASHMGWIHNNFAPYDNTIKYDGDNSFNGFYNAISGKGNYEKWRTYCHKLRQKSIYLRLQMAASFASPILEKIGALPFILHLWGGTEAGKTVGMMVAMSIWGNPKLGSLVRTMDMTLNNMTTCASFLYSLPFAGDELQLIKAENYDKLIMRCCEGIDRGRNTSKSSIEFLKTWHNCFLFTGEEPIIKASSGGGAKNRVIEIEIKDGEKVIADGNAVANFVTDNYGFAGKRFIEAIKKVDLRPKYSELFSSILSVTDTTEKQAMPMACMLLADQIAVQTFFSEESPLTINQVKPFMATTHDVDKATRAYGWVCDWIATNGNRFIDDDHNYGELWGKVEDSIATINKSVLQSQMQKAGYDYSAIIGKWATRGQIIKNSQGKFIHQTKVFNVKASYVKLVLPNNTDDNKGENTDDSNVESDNKSDGDLQF